MVADTNKAKRIFKFKPSTNINKLIKIMIDNATRNRDIAHTNFTSLCLKLKENLAMNTITESIERERKEIQIHDSH